MAEQQRVSGQSWGVAVTGSRTWPDPSVILRAFQRVERRKPGWEIRLFHGQCDPQTGRGKTFPWARAMELPHEAQMELCGADWLADVIARGLGWGIHRMPAAWEAPCRPECKPGHRQRRWTGDGATYCPAAGNYRNTSMLTGGGVDDLLAFVDRCQGKRLRCAGKPPHGSHGTLHAVAEARSKTTVQVFPYTIPELEGITV